MHDSLIIIGASGHGKVVADVALKMKIWENIYFLDNNKNLEKVLGLEVLGPVKDARKYKNCANFFVAIGKNEIRKKIQDQLMDHQFQMTTLIHPSAIIGCDVKIGLGTVVMAGAVINSSTKIEKGCIINTSSIIEHDNHIAEYVHISPGARTAGTVKISQLSWLGMGSTIINNVSITQNCTIAAGSVVTKDIKKPGTYIGSPVKRVK